MGIQFDTHIQYLKGVGPRLGDLFRKRGVSTVGELLEWYPRTYEDRRAARNIASLEPDQVVSIRAKVRNVRSINMGRSRRKMYDITVADSSGQINCKYFRVPYKGYFDRFSGGPMVQISGKVTLYRGRKEFHHPDIEIVDEAAPIEDKDILIPLYTETDGLSPAKLRKLMGKAIHELDIEEGSIPDPVPDTVLEKYGLMDRRSALKLIHQPDGGIAEEYLEYRSPAQKRLIFEEFFWMEMHMASRRAGVKKESAPSMTAYPDQLKEIQDALPFDLTAAQKRVLGEIVSDLEKPHPMHRLVQGDVGSGKTLVALLAAVMAKANGYQTALMAPTEILAGQHFKNAKKFLEDAGIRVGLVTGHLKAKEYNEVTKALKSGELDLIVGTHALIEDSVEFKNLGLVIVDEQHRFGVEQRMKLKKKTSPHFLVMTATPIPRTLAMTVYGDLDVSLIDELPPGRSPVVTRKVFPSKREKVYSFMQEQIQKGRQAYIIYPLVEESEKMDLKDAVSECEKLQGQFPNIKFGLLHGKMKADEKAEVMERFRRGEIDVMVSTTVIEVGVDVPNANMMIIEHSERFGLSQLHQLRGRVGRGEHKSYCVLMLEYAHSEEALARAEVIAGTTDGFKIAEADLELRGPGEFLGRRQSGLPGFRMANLVRDLPILKVAREAAFNLMSSDPDLSRPEHKALKIILDRQTDQMVG